MQFGAVMSRKCPLVLSPLHGDRLTLLFLQTGWSMGAFTEVRRLRDFDSSRLILMSP